MNLESRISRRSLLKATGSGVALAMLRPFEAIAQSPSPSSEVESPETKPKYEFIQLGGDEYNLSLEEQGLRWVPDGHIPYVTLADGTRRYFVTAKVSTHIIATNGENLKDAIQSGRVINQTNLREVYTPDVNAAYKNGYTGITSVVQPNLSDLNHLIGVTHNEQHQSQGDGTGFTASVSIVESKDGGLTWTDTGKLLQGLDTKEPGGQPVSGVGQPSSMIIGDHLYIWHIDWSANGKHADQIYLSRISIDQDGQLGDFERLTNDGFKQDAKIEELKPVISVPTDVPNAVYAALPSISWNTFLNKYLCVFETAVGFYQATSEDGINWDNYKLFAQSPVNYHDRETMDPWFSYPTLISDDAFENDHTTGSSGILYYSKGFWRAGSHNLVARDFEII